MRTPQAGRQARCAATTGVATADQCCSAGHGRFMTEQPSNNPTTAPAACTGSPPGRPAVSGEPAAAGGCAGPGCRRGCAPPRRWPARCAPAKGEEEVEEQGCKRLSPCQRKQQAWKNQESARVLAAPTQTSAGAEAIIRRASVCCGGVNCCKRNRGRGGSMPCPGQRAGPGLGGWHLPSRCRQRSTQWSAGGCTQRLRGLGDCR